MRMTGKKGIALLLTLMMLLGAMPVSARAAAIQPLPKKDWTVAVYMCGSDLEGDNGCGSMDLLEMLDASVPDNVNVLVATGGAERWNPDGYDYDGFVTPRDDVLQVFRVTKNGMEEFYYYTDELNMSDPSTIATFLTDMVELAPADHMFPILWDHGGGPVGASLYDEKFDDALYLMDIQAALDYAAQKRGKKFDLVGFDTCLMGSIEVACALADSANYLVGSEEVEPGIGWNYHWLDVFNQYAGKMNSLTPQIIGKTIIDTYDHASVFEDAAGWEKESGLTLALTDLSKAKAAGAAVNELGNQMSAALRDSGARAAIARAAQSAKSMRSSPELVDLYTLAKALENVPAVADAAKKVTSMLGTMPSGILGQVSTDKLILYRGATKDYKSCLGLSIYYPTAKSEVDKEDVDYIYSETGFTGGYASYAYSVARSAKAAGEDGAFRGKILGRYDDANEQFAATVDDPAQLDRLVYMETEVWYRETENDPWYELGVMPLKTEDWAGNRFVSAFDGNWLAVNGQIFTYEAEVLEDGAVEYTLPIEIVRTEGGKTEYDDAWLYGTLENGRLMVNGVVNITEDSLGKGYLPKAGFTFCTILMEAENEDGTAEYLRNEPITLTEALKSGDRYALSVDTESAPDGSYAVVFCGYDLNHDIHYSDDIPMLIADYKAEGFAFDPIAKQVYTGSPVEPRPLLRYQGVAMNEQDKNFKVSYVNNVEPGTAQVVIETTLTEEPATLTQSFEIVRAEDYFTDVNAGLWAAKAIWSAASLGLMGEKESGRFAPAEGLTRRDFARALCVLDEARPETDPMTWALENGVVNEGEAPDVVLTREEMVAMLYRLAGLWELDTGSNVTLNRYADSADVSVSAFNALRWAVGKGYVNGMDGGVLEPKSKASRAQAAALLDRFAAENG